MSDWAGILLTVFLLAANAFFVGAEFALISARRSQIEPRAQAGSRMARTTLKAMEKVSLMMAGAQLGITMASLGLGAVSEPALAHLMEPVFHDLGLPDAWLHPVAFVIAMTIVVFLHVVVGEMVPKNIAIAGPDRAALIAPSLELQNSAGVTCVTVLESRPKRQSRDVQALVAAMIRWRVRSDGWSGTPCRSK